MKRVVSVGLGILCVAIMTMGAGCHNPVEPELYDLEDVDVAPSLIGHLGDYAKHIEYPEIERKAGVQGDVHLAYVVDTQGDVVEPVVVQGVSDGLDEEAVRLILLLKYKPGMHRGMPVRVRMQEVIKFRLQ